VTFRASGTGENGSGWVGESPARFDAIHISGLCVGSLTHSAGPRRSKGRGEKLRDSLVERSRKPVCKCCAANPSSTLFFSISSRTRQPDRDTDSNNKESQEFFSSSCAPLPTQREHNDFALLALFTHPERARLVCLESPLFVVVDGRCAALGVCHRRLFFLIHTRVGTEGERASE